MTWREPCENCDDRKCMGCVLREIHDMCENDCPSCCSVIDKARSLLGKRVRVTLDHDGHRWLPARVTEGTLVAMGDDGTFEVIQDDGFVHYCWPMLDIEEVAPEVAPKWNGELLARIQARGDVVACCLLAVKQRYDGTLDTGEQWTAVDEAARRLVAADNAYREKAAAIERVRGVAL